MSRQIIRQSTYKLHITFTKHLAWITKESATFFIQSNNKFISFKGIIHERIEAVDQHVSHIEHNYQTDNPSGTPTFQVLNLHLLPTYHFSIPESPKNNIVEVIRTAVHLQWSSKFNNYDHYHMGFTFQSLHASILHC